MSAKLEQARRQQQIAHGACFFFRAHPELNDCDANINMLANAIPADQPLDRVESWEKAFQQIKSQLAGPAPKSPPRTIEIEREPWNHKFPDFRDKDGKPDYKTLMRLTPGKMYTDFYNDKRGGEITQSALDFRRLAQEAIDLENERRNS